MVGGDYLLDWLGPIILPYQRANMTFDEPGYYEWNGRKMPTLERPDWWESHANGRILVLDDDMNRLSKLEKARIAQNIIMNSEIPVTTSGTGANDVLHIGLNSAITQNIPDATKYYKSRIQQLVPFEVEFKIG